MRVLVGTSLLLLLLMQIFSNLCYGQNRTIGTVVEVIDGRTFLLEAPSGKITCVLQYIEVPEPEQPLHQTMIDHLRALTMGKKAEFQATAMTPSQLTGRLMIDGVDISIQMLRDGAAWLVPAEQTGQSNTEFAAYKESEDRAKAERLGVWSIPNLKPAWVVRAENEERLRKELALKPKPRARLDITSEFQTISHPGRPTAANSKLTAFDKDMWLDVFAGTGVETPGLKTYSDPKGRFNVVYTPVAFVTLSDVKIKQRLECRVGYVDHLLVNGQHTAEYLIAFRALSDEYNFSSRLSRLSLTVDGQAASMAIHHGFKGKGSIGAEELMFYRVPVSLLKKMVSAGKVNVKIDKVSGVMGTDLQSLIGRLLAATE